MFPAGHAPLASSLRPHALRAAVLLSAALLLAGARTAAAQSGEAALADDARLDEKVTLKLTKTPLSEVTAELGKAAGVALETTPDTADEPAVVWVTDQPAREVMRQLARLFNYRWTRSGNAGEYRYELYQDLNAKQAEEALRQQDRLRAVQALRDDLPKRAEMLRERPNPRQEVSLRLAMGLTPAQWNTLAGGQTLLFSTRQQPGAAPLPPALAAEILRNQGQSQGEVQAVHVRLWVSYSNSEARLHHMQRVTRMGSAGEGGGSLANSFSQPPRGREAGPDQVAAWQRDPVLGARRPFGVDPVKAAPARRLTPGQPSILHVYEILPALAEAYGIDLIADAYRTQRFGRQPAAMPQELALYEALNRHLEHVGDWARDGEFIRARSRTWYHDRLAEIPARVIRHWNTRLRRERQMTLDDAAAVALSLRNEQLAQFEGALADEGIQLHSTGYGRGAAFHAGGNRELLRAFGTLQPRQQELLRSGGQIAFADMPPGSRGWLLAAAEERRRQFATVELPPGELPPGLLSLSSVTVRREVTSVEEGQVRSILRALDGPEQGKELSSNSMGGPVPPALTEGGQVFRQLAWRYQFSEMWALTSPLTLPWVYIDPSVKQEPPDKTMPAAP